jgi:hypothetical protein
MAASADDFTIWVNRQPRGQGQLDARGATLKDGPTVRVRKTVKLTSFGDAETGNLSKRELRFTTYPRLGNGLGFDFTDRDSQTTWYCENEEIEKLLAFLHAEVDSTGRYRAVDTASPVSAILELLNSGQVTTEEVSTAFTERSDLADVVKLLATSKDGQIAAQHAVITQRRELVKQLQQMVADPTTTETDVQRVMGDAYWIFGGRYVGVSQRRNLVMLDEHDIPLLGADGTLHIVELKGPVIEKLIRRHRNHWIVGYGGKDGGVHEAVGQATNYLRELDQDGNGLTTKYRNELGVDYDMQRVFATVVIGSHQHVTQPKDAPPITRSVIEQTIRSYNAHLSRVEVVTFDTLLENAERALSFEDAMLAGRRPGSDVVVLPPDPLDTTPEAVAMAEPWNR